MIRAKIESRQYTWSQIVSGFEPKKDPEFNIRNNILYDTHVLYPKFNSLKDLLDMFESKKGKELIEDATTHKPDIILTEGSSSLLNASIVFIYSKLCNKKFIWWSLGMLEGRRYSGIRGLIGRWEKVIEQNSDAIFTYSSAGKRYFISRGVNSEKIFRGINVLDTQRKLAEIKNFVSVSDHNIDSSKFNVAFIGTITKEKNLTMLLQAVRLFNAHFKDTIVLHVIGDGDYMPLLKENILSLNLEQQVVLHGRINSGASTILSQCKVMVLPGLGGLAICEAMLNRMAVITGIADGTENDLVSENNGFIIKNIDDKKIAEKLLIFYQDNALLERFRNESFNLITGKFHFDNYYQNFSDAVEYVSNSK
jgi:glycosyltransferase involved in cell wall biosynthesis